MELNLVRETIDLQAVIFEQLLNQVVIYMVNSQKRKFKIYIFISSDWFVWLITWS